jgi:hypothetical protein
MASSGSNALPVDASAAADPGGHLLFCTDFDGASCRKLTDALAMDPLTNSQSFLGLARADNAFGLGGIGSQPHLLKCWGAIVASVILTSRTFALPTKAPAEYDRAFYHRRQQGNAGFLFLFFTSGCFGVVVPRGIHTFGQPSVFFVLMRCRQPDAAMDGQIEQQK